MSRISAFIVFFFLIILASGCDLSLEKRFKNPPDEFKPMPLWHINGELTTEGIKKQLTDAKELANFSGVAVLPMSDRSETRPGTSPQFLTENYFQKYLDIIAIAEDLDMEVILYDDVDYPSGMAGGKMQELFPEFTRKRLDKIEKKITGPANYSDTIPEGKLMAIVAMNTDNLERIELSRYAQNGRLNWQVPAGTWNIMYFIMVKDGSHKKYLMVDYMDTTAVNHLMSLTYDVYAEEIGNYFGNTIKKVFFDDVGFFQYERGWTGTFNQKFVELNEFDPKPYYPALWYDIGPETEAIRHAFFKTRAELLANGFLKQVGKWAKNNNLKDTGHPPGNYRISPIDMNGDIFKFYQYTAIPLTDAILGYGTGRDGFKLISSAADYYDKPVVATEIYGAFKEKNFDSLMLYRPLMEQMLRGVNLVMPHGMWYNSDPEKIYISPLVSPYSEKLAPALPAYSDFVARTCMMLQHGKRVAEIGILYPFESLAGYFYFDCPKRRYGVFASPQTDYMKISDLLTNEIRRDFTFIHPEFFLEDKYSIQNESIILNNKENTQEYKAMFLTGCNIISYKTLSKLAEFYASGGVVISTTQLPYKSSEMGHDEKVIKLIREIFGIDPLTQNKITEVITNSNDNGGHSIFLPELSREKLDTILRRYLPAPDVDFINNPVLASELGKFSYIHKVKNGKNIYYFANSSDDHIDTEILLKGKMKPERWNPHSGLIEKIIDAKYVQKNEEEYTKVKLMLDPVKSVFYITDE